MVYVECISGTYKSIVNDLARSEASDVMSEILLVVWCYLVIIIASYKRMGAVSCHRLFR